jgi:hypothetical protein
LVEIEAHVEDSRAEDVGVSEDRLSNDVRRPAWDSSDGVGLSYPEDGWRWLGGIGIPMGLFQMSWRPEDIGH